MAGYTTGQAGVTVQPTTVPTAYSGDAQELARSQRLAQMLMSSEMPQGQMVSGRFVAPSITQNIAQLVNAGTGAYFADKADKQQLELARKIREGEQGALQDYMSIINGTPAVGDQPAVAGNPRMANMRIAQNELAPSWLRQHAITQITKPPQYKEVSKVNEKTGNTEIYRYDINAADPLSTMQFLGIGKPALSKAEQINFADQNINTNIGGTNAPAGGVTPPAGGAVQPKPVSQKTDKTADYDYFKAPPAPAGLSGKQTRDFITEQNKPLTGKPNDEVIGAVGYQKSLDKLVNLFNQYKGSDMLKPNVKAEFKSALRTAQLQGKEAFGLGVLNGPDLEILEQVLIDPTAFDAFLKDRSTINKLYNNQRTFTADKIKTNYRTSQKAVPENLREYVEIKPIDLVNASGSDIQATLKKLNVPYDPTYEYKVNPDGTVDKRKKR